MSDITKLYLTKFNIEYVNKLNDHILTISLIDNGVKKYGLYDYITNEILIYPIYQEIDTLSNQNLYFFRYKNNLGFFDNDGKIIISPMFDTGYKFQKDLYTYVNIDDIWFLISNTGEIIQECKKDEVDLTLVTKLTRNAKLKNLKFNYEI